MTGSDPVDPAVARLLDDTPVWAEVSSGLRERTLAAALGAEPAARVIASFAPEAASAGAESAAAGAEGHGGQVVRPAWGRARGPARPQGRTRRRPALLAAAAAAVAVAGLAVGGGLRLVGGGTADRGVEVALTGTGQAPAAVATARLRDEPAGVAITLEVAELPPAPKDTFYETWLVGENGKVSAGTFHQRGEQDHVDLWLGVDPDDYDAITVTRQPVAGGSLAEGVVLLRGELPDS